VLYAGDGVVDGPAALAAMTGAVLASPFISVETATLSAIDGGSTGIVAHLDNGRTVTADAVVLAAGAWTPAIRGLPRPIRVRPLRGVMVAVEAELIDVPIYDAEGHAYLLPRGPRTIVGATSDDVGFDWSAPADAAARLLGAASKVVPSLVDYPASKPWAGLRPMTPDGLALIGEDPALPGLFYACGHGRNGFLHAALTGEVVASLIEGERVVYDLAPFDPTRSYAP
jgi:glycine oxidase